MWGLQMVSVHVPAKSGAPSTKADKINFFITVRFKNLTIINDSAAAEKVVSLSPK